MINERFEMEDRHLEDKRVWKINQKQEKRPP